MDDFKISNQQEYSINGLILSINDYYTELKEDSNTIIKHFLNPHYFKHKDFHEIIRESNKTNPNFLDIPFNLDKIEINDFNILNTEEVLEFFNKETTWYDDYAEILRIQDKFKEIINSFAVDKYYVLSIDFFDKSTNDKGECKNVKINYNACIYETYLLIIWHDKENNKLIVSETIFD